jgi:Uncharacterized protein conserved in archaea
MKKFAIFVHASENEGARALHALLYTQELYEAGYEVKLIFDGAGTVWIKKFEDEKHPHNPLYKAVKKLGVIAGACQYCAGSFGVADAVKEAGIRSLGDAKGHPSLSNFVKEGFQILII